MQYLDQVDVKLTGALFGNVGSLITFRLGMKDASVVQNELFPTRVIGVAPAFH